MSDNITDAVKAFLQQKRGPHQLDEMHNIQMQHGRRNKRSIDAHRSSQDYYRMQTIQTPLLHHYENVDWYERDSSMDLEPYM